MLPDRSRIIMGNSYCQSKMLHEITLMLLRKSYSNVYEMWFNEMCVNKSVNIYIYCLKQNTGMTTCLVTSIAALIFKPFL